MIDFHTMLNLFVSKIGAFRAYVISPIRNSTTTATYTQVNTVSVWIDVHTDLNSPSSVVVFPQQIFYLPPSSGKDAWLHGSTLILKIVQLYELIFALKFNSLSSMVVSQQQIFYLPPFIR